jgi:hypothetical protein
MTWRKSSYSGSQTNCVELGLDRVRDSKNPRQILLGDVIALVAAVKTDRLSARRAS